MPVRLRRSEWRVLSAIAHDANRQPIRTRGQAALNQRMRRRGLILSVIDKPYSISWTAKGEEAFCAHPSNWGAFSQAPANCRVVPIPCAAIAANHFAGEHCFACHRARWSAEPADTSKDVSQVDADEG